MREKLLSFLHSHYKLSFFAVSLAVVLIGAKGLFKGTPVVEASNMNQKYYQCITVEEDETLWSIADIYCTEEYDSYAEYITEVKHINNLTDDKIYSGACLVIPYYAAPQ